MKNEVSDEIIQGIMGEINSDGVGVFGDITAELREAVLKIVIETQNEKLAIDILHTFADYDSEQESKLTPQQKEQLKNLILKTQNADSACIALSLDYDEHIFTKEEKLALLKIAVTTQNPYMAYFINYHYPFELKKNKEARSSLRKVIVWVQDPAQAFYFLQRQDDNLDSYDDDLKSLSFTNEDIQRFKNVIISSGSPEWSCRLLITKKTAERADNRESFGYDEPHSIVELTPNERTTLIRSIIESRDSFWAYGTLRDVDDLSEGERMVLKGIMVQTEDINLACNILCNTDLISFLNETDRAHLKKLAVQVKDKYNANKILTYVYDLTPEEKEKLEKIL
ncbi:hypothetical protein HXX01_04035 [Candidatus Nomurabacteria bacterium]|nr:hypothetical protein [Candidatus Nomurabacteria bacterium]